MRYALSWTDAQVRHIRPVTPTVRLFEIVPDRGGPEPYPVGSHINVEVFIRGLPETRSYSLVGEPAADCYRIAVKRLPESRGGSAYMWSLTEGARLTITHPQSHFDLEYGHAEYLLIAGGIGITPIYGMALNLARRGANLRMAYAARTRAELAFGDELRDVLGPRLQTFVSDEGRHLDIRSALTDLGPGGLAAVCGPLPMLDEVRRVWRELERNPGDLRFETFGSSGTRASEAFRVRLMPQNREIVVPETQSMLDALNRAGFEIMSDCERGECGICAVDVLDVEGEIDHRDVFFSDEQKKESHKMCTCVSRAIGTVTIDTAYRPD
jgi:vanillate monooxygenase ferredoxin subunit